jgi:hypothetical protein
MRPSDLLALSVCVLLAVPPALARPNDRAPGGGPGEVQPPPIVDVTWDELERHGVTWLGRQVRFVVQFDSVRERWSGLETRFTPGSYVAARAWSDEQDLWIADEFASPRVDVYARRGGACAWTLAQATSHARYEVVGVVREVFAGRPWIEVERLTALIPCVGEASVIHAERAWQMFEAGAYSLAEAEFEQALAADLPARARTTFEQGRTACREAIEEQRARAGKPAR